MAYEFTANTFEADERQRLIGFANDDHYVWMQPDEEPDLAPAFDAANVWIEIHDQQFGGPGGIQRIALSRQEFTVTLTPAKAAKMGKHGEISVRLSVGDDEFDRIRAVLLIVMRGSEHLVEIHL